jgi:hypothetical protein
MGMERMMEQRHVLRHSGYRGWTGTDSHFPRGTALGMSFGESFHDFHDPEMHGAQKPMSTRHNNLQQVAPSH